MDSASDEDFQPERRARLIRQIEAAFADVPYPGDDHIVDMPDYFEAIHLANRLRGKHWSEVPSRVIELENQEILFFTREGFQYYFPAYLLYCLREDLPHSGAIVFDHLVSRLVRHPEEDPEAYAERRHWAAFTPAQRAVIREFMLFVRDYIAYKRVQPPEHIAEDQANIDLALARYWGK